MSLSEVVWRDLEMKGVFVLNSSLHDILFMILDNELRKHYHEIAIKQGLCQVTYDDFSSLLITGSGKSVAFPAFETQFSSNFTNHLQTVFDDILSE